MKKGTQTFKQLKFNPNVGKYTYFFVLYLCRR